MNLGNIFSSNKRQFDTTMKREGITVSDYFDASKTYNVFFRRNERSTTPQGKVRLFYSQDTPITIGTIFILKGIPYVVTSQDGIESDIYYTSMAVKCDTTFTIYSKEKYITVPFVVASDKSTVGYGNIFNMVSGNVVVYTADNAIVRDMVVNNCYYNFGGYYKVGNVFYNNGLAYIYMEQEVKPQEDTYKLVYNGETVINKSTTSTYQLSYTALKNDVIEDNPTLTYSSSDTSVATVDANGLMTILSIGSVKITTTWNGTTCATDFNITSSGANYSIKITASTDTVIVGGSYKKLTLNFFDTDNTDITDTTIADMTRDDFVWTCSIDGVDVTNNTDLITWYNGSSEAVNVIRIKFADDRSYLTKMLNVSCEVGGMKTSKDFEISGS